VPSRQARGELGEDHRQVVAEEDAAEADHLAVEQRGMALEGEGRRRAGELLHHQRGGDAWRA
jgi:hypothetical protein